MAAKKFQPPEQSWQNMNHSLTEISMTIKTELPALRKDLNSTNKTWSRVALALIGVLATLAGGIIVLAGRLV